MSIKAKVWLQGVLSYVPGMDARSARSGGGGTASARYCYSVWLRHLVKAHGAGLNTMPSTVAELGPGDSVGVGLAALLSGSERYWALDVISYANQQRNLETLDGLVDLFSRRAPIPDEEDLVEVRPSLDSYAFPRDVLTEERLRSALTPARVARLRQAIADLGSRAGDENASISYMVSWNDASRVRAESIDAVFSQAVMEHVEDIVGTYRAIRAWLKPGGYMSHQIDFRCHGTTEEWNGHWGVSDLTWRIAQGRRRYFVNREACSRHFRAMAELGFKVVLKVPQEGPRGIDRSALAHRFRDLSDDDLKTNGLFVQAVKGESP